MVVGIDAWLLFHTAKFVTLRGRARPDLTGGRNESYHVHSSHGGLLDAARHGSRHSGGLCRHPRGLPRTLPNRLRNAQKEIPPSKRIAPTDARLRPANKRPLRPVLVMLTPRLFAAVHFAPVPMRAPVSFAATAATLQAQASCTTSCCTKFKLCLGQRQCDLRGIVATTCEEGRFV